MPTIRYAEDEQGNRTAWRQAVDDKGNKKWFQVDMPQQETETKEPSILGSIRDFIDPPKGEGFSYGRMLVNLPNMSREAGSQAWDAITNPVQTAKSIADFYTGAYHKFTPGEQPEEQLVDDWIKRKKELYSNFPESLEENLFEMAGDLRAGLSVGTRPFSKGMSNEIIASDPFNIAVNSMRMPLKMIPQSKIMGDLESATKLPYSKIKKAANAYGIDETTAKNKLYQTQLDYDLKPSSAGVDKLTDQVEIINSKVDNILSANADTPISLKHVDKEMFKLLREKSDPATNLNASENAAFIENAYGKWRNDLGKDYVTAKDLNKLKKNTAKLVNYESGAKTQPIAEEFYEAAARGARRGVETIDPNIKTLNSQIRDLLQLKPGLAQSARRIENRDIGGIGPSIKATGAGMIGGKFGAALGYLHGLRDAPGPKSSLALWMNRQKNNPMQNVYMDNNSLSGLLLREALQEGQNTEY